MTLLFLSMASAQDVAVLPFDGYGVPYDEVQMAPQGFRDALLEEGSYFPLSEYDVTNRLSTGRQDDIAEARRLVAQARTSLDKGEPSSALSLLNQALELHEDADSAWARRSELADVHYFIGAALIKKGRRTEAIASFVEALYLFPGYGETRAPTMTPAIESALSEAARFLDESEPRMTLSGDLERLSVALDAEFLVTGYVDLDGTLFARMTQGGEVVGESSRSMMVVPPYPGEPIYLEMVEEMMGGALELGSEPVVEPEEEFFSIAGSGPIGTSKKTIFSREPDEEEVGTISGTKSRAPRGRQRDKRITEEWWFWTMGGVAIAGGVAGLVYWNTSDGNTEEPDSVQGSVATYTVVVEGP